MHAKTPLPFFAIFLEVMVPANKLSKGLKIRVDKKQWHQPDPTAQARKKRRPVAPCLKVESSCRKTSTRPNNII